MNESRLLDANSIAKLRVYFEDIERPLGNTEFRDFWASLTELEKAYYRYVDLETGLLPMDMQALL